jgi:AraC-like DNA-binding protein
MKPRRPVILRSLLVPALVRRAGALGIAVDDLLDEHRVDRAAVAEGVVEIGCDALRSFSAKLAARANDDLFGFRAALEMPRGAYGLFEYLVRNAGTLGELLGMFVRYSRLINAQLIVRFDRQTGRLEESIDGELECLGKQGNEFSLAHQVKVVRESMRYAIPIERLYFAHAKGSDDRELAAFFGTTDIVYGAGFNGVDLAERTLASTSTGADASLFRVLEERARDLITQFAGTDELEPVRRAIATALEQGEPNAKRIAQHVGMSERTLHRRLSAADTSFRRLVDDLRHKIALSHLSESQLAMSDIAMLLGYSDGRAFARAFRRWTGETPAQWRNKVR